MKSFIPVILIAIVAVVSVLAMGVYAYTKLASSRANPNAPGVAQSSPLPQTTTEVETIVVENDAVEANQTNQANARYLPFSPGVYLQAANQRRVLFFYANWCPTCRPADQNFQANLDEIPDDVVVIRVNYNDSETDQTEQELAEQYNITYQHTFVQLDDQGNPVAQWNGGQLPELLANLR